ncbi:DUF6350 family protein [Galbitalea soli]|uniref:Uncharacterized protein n=1 Tax=Galbitalea soli TaxID=1268042 RepID=A0A7C9PPE4_9MICO|nr:DUF6350 family protein [Galbitalea soli]NEM92230.1 hypothetical protein [Galbitalea soli]NYJ31816.1 hypothetical protein [Galbitalea soli]
MNRSLTALLGALEALVVAAIGIGIPLVPLTVLWGAQYGFAPDWGIFWRVSADIWLVGHGADLALTLDAGTAKASGFAAAGAPFTITMAALGFALLTVLLARRAGHRIAEFEHRAIAAATAVVTFALLSLGIAITARQPLATGSLGQGITLPTLVFALGLLLGGLRARRDGIDLGEGPVLRRIEGWVRGDVRAVIRAAVRGGAAATLAVVSVAAVLLAVLLAVNYAAIITLFEDIHAGPLGGAALTIGQLAVLPNLIVWVASWLVGPGFAIGAGSSVSPAATILGPLPAVPVFGAIPHVAPAFGFVGLLVPVLAGFLAGALLHGPLVPALPMPRRTLLSLATAAAMGVVGGVLLGALAWMAAGAVGPGRLQVVGPDPLAVGGWAALEIGLAAIAGMAAASRRAAGR